MHLLLIEDDLDFGRALQASLKLAGISSQWLRRADDAPPNFNEALFDCVLLDLSLPDADGLQLLARWRSSGERVPVIVITARTTLQERLLGLDTGADDFLIKPFATDELIARVRAVLRRYAGRARELWQVGDLCIEPRSYRARIGSETLSLSPREMHLLIELAREPGTVVAKKTLAQRLEPLGDAIDFATLEVHVSNLRRKIGAARITTVRGIGYLLSA
jgi:DNA-binding response OmpR family regulator